MVLTLQSVLAFAIPAIQALMTLIPAGPATVIAQVLLSLLQQFSGNTTNAAFMARPPVALPPQPWTPDSIKEWAHAQHASAP